MTPDEFIAFVDAWIAKGGEFRDPEKHNITTAAEVDAICRALDSVHIFAANCIHTPAFFCLAVYFHYAKTKAAIEAVRASLSALTAAPGKFSSARSRIYAAPGRPSRN